MNTCEACQVEVQDPELGKTRTTQSGQSRHFTLEDSLSVEGTGIVDAVCTTLIPPWDIFSQLQVVLLENSPRGFIEKSKQTPFKTFNENNAKSK